MCVHIFAKQQQAEEQHNIFCSYFSFQFFPRLLPCFSPLFFPFVCLAAGQFLCSSCCCYCCRKCFLQKVLCILCSFANVVKCATPLALPQTAAACLSLLYVSLFLSLSTLSDCNGQFNYSQVVSHQILIYLQAATLEQLATHTQRVRERGRQAGSRCGSCNAFAARITRCSSFSLICSTKLRS